MTKPPPDGAAAAAETTWFVQAAGEVWGPYNRARVERFVVEGRVTPLSLLAIQIEGPFEAAARWRSLAPLFQPSPLPSAKPYQHRPAPHMASPDTASGPTPGVQAPPAVAPQPAPAPNPRAAPRRDLPQAAKFSAPVRPLLVWADLASVDAPQFEALLRRYGVLAAIRPTVWLLQARCDAAALRNALSRRLTGADALMIVQAPLDQAAWFNLDSAAERGLRQLWGEAGG